MRQLTIRGFEPELERQIEKTAEELGISLNKAVLHLLRKGSGLTKSPEPEVIGHRLDFLFGTWSQEDEEEFREATRGFGEIDPEMWE